MALLILLLLLMSCCLLSSAEEITAQGCTVGQAKIISMHYYFEEPSINLKYQTIDYDSSQEMFNFKVDFEATANCHILKVELFSYSQIVDGLLHFPLTAYDVNTTKTPNVTLSAASLNDNKNESTTFFRLTAVDMYDRLCSDSLSNQTFYRFLRSGIPQWSFQNHSTIIRLPIPVTKCDQLMFTWPKVIGGDNNCFCALSTSEIYSFGDCVKSCKSQYQLEFLQDSIVFFNITTSDRFLTHFLCDENPCVYTQGSCFMESLITSHSVSIDTSSSSAAAETSCSSSYWVPILTFLLGIFITVVVIILCIRICKICRNSYSKVK